MTFAEALTLASSIGSFAAGLAAFVTILEMRRQSRITTGATIIIHSVQLSFFKPHPFSLSSPGILTRERPETPMAVGSDAYIDCVNLGPGVAKEISYAWKADIDDVIAVIAEADTTQRYEIWHDQHGAFESVKIGFKGQRSSVHNLNTQLRRQAGFLRPSDEAGLRLQLPRVYLELYEIYLDLLPVEKLLEEGPKVLSLWLTLTYSDISNRQSQKSFVVTPSVTMWSAGRTNASPDTTSDKPALSGHVSLNVTEM